MLLLLVRKPHVRRIDSLAGLERPQTAASTTGPSGWGCSTAGFSCRGCLPEFLHLRSISLIRMAWDSSLPRAHGIQWEHIQCCAEDSPLLFKGKTLILVPQPCSLPTSQSLITPILGGCDLYSLFRMSCPPLPRECSVISEKEETGYWAASTVFVPSRDWLNKLQFIKKLEYSATKTMRKIWINHYRKASLTWLTEKSTVAEDPISIISFLFEGK